MLKGAEGMKEAMSLRIEEINKEMDAHNLLGENINFITRAIIEYIEAEPENYLRYTSSVFVMLELIVMLTPAVALGMQWVTALCPGAPVQSIVELCFVSWQCFLSISKEECEMTMRDHCIVRM